jgi:AraC-like DNA-binding protein
MRDRQLERFVRQLQVFVLIRFEQSSAEANCVLKRIARQADRIQLHASRLVADWLICRASTTVPLHRGYDHRGATDVERKDSAGTKPSTGPLEASEPNCGRYRPHALEIAVETLIAAEYADPFINLTDVSRKLRVSKCHLCRVLRKNSGRTFQQLLRAARLKAAAEILTRSDAPVKAVSYDVGYKQLSHFCQDFKKMYGRTPTEYRVNST